MPPLTTIIKNDLGVIGTAVKSGLYGAVHGLYTPFALRTGKNHWNDRLNKNWEQQYHSENPLDRVRFNAESFGQGFAVTGVYSASFYFAMSEGRVKEYFAALVVTNLIDYAVGVVKRNRK